MAITRKIHFQINFDYKVMTNYKIMSRVIYQLLLYALISYCYMH